MLGLEHRAAPLFLAGAFNTGNQLADRTKREWSKPRGKGGTGRNHQFGRRAANKHHGALPFEQISAFLIASV
jgi:hypothetical protein